MQSAASSTSFAPPLRRHPKIFTPAEAAAYLGLESERSLETVRKDYGLVGHKAAGKQFLYWKDELDRVALKMFGMVDQSESLNRGGRRA